MLDLSPKVLKTMGEIEKISVDMNVTRMLRARRDEILDAIGTRSAELTPELLRELAELDDALGIEPLEYPDVADIETLRLELREEEKETYRAAIRAEIAAESDETGRFCLELALSQIDDPLSPWNQE